MSMCKPLPSKSVIIRRLQSSIRQRSSSTTGGYQSIGSFHSDNIEELIRLSDDDYIAPDLPFEEEKKFKTTPTLSSSTSSAPFSNSKKFSECYSHLDRREFSFLNHGAFGFALDVGLSRAQSWRKFLELQPLRYFDRYLLNHLTHSARCLVDFVAAEEKDKMRKSIALISNVKIVNRHGKTKRTYYSENTITYILFLVLVLADDHATSTSQMDGLFLSWTIGVGHPQSFSVIHKTSCT